MMYHYYGDGYGYGMDPFGSVFHILGFVLIVVIIVAVIRMLTGRGRRMRRFMGNSALDLLAERYAKGEIDKDEYEEKKKVLSS